MNYSRGNFERGMKMNWIIRVNDNLFFEETEEMMSNHIPVVKSASRATKFQYFSDAQKKRDLIDRCLMFANQKLEIIPAEATLC